MTRRGGLGIILLAAVAAVQAQNYEVPAGFESFMAPQETLVDVYYGDRLVLTTPARFTPDQVTFLEPDAVIGAMPQVRPDPWLLAVLGTPLNSNGGKVCVRVGQQNCGTIEPRVAGVIFDEQNFRADLFVNPQYVMELEADAPQYLPEPEESRWGAVQNLSFNQAGSSDGDNHVSLFGRTLVGKGTQYGFANWVSTDEQGLSFDELGWQRDLPDHQIQAGLFLPSSDMLTMINRQPMAGVGVSRSLLRRQDLDSAFATSLEVFLSSRSRVEIYKDDRLYSATFMEAGRRRLDTSRLPGGAYTVEVRITDANGNTRSEQQFFVKSRRLAPQGERLWFAQLGEAMAYARDQVMPEDQQTPLLMTGARQRFTESLGAGLALASTDSEMLLELNSDWFTRYAQLFGSGFAGSAGAGYTLRGSANIDNWQVILDSQRVWTDDPDPLELEPDFRLLPLTLERDSLDVWIPLWKGRVSLGLRRQKLGEEGEVNRTTSLGYVRTFQLGGGQILNLSGNVSQTDGDNQILIGANWLMTRGHWQHQANLGWAQDEAYPDDDGVAASLATSWNDRDLYASDLTLGASVNHQPSQDSLLLRGDYSSGYGRGQAGVAFNQSRRGVDNTQTSLGYDTSLVVGDGASLGGATLYDAAVLLKLEGAEGAEFEVLVNGDQKAVIRGGATATLTLPAYQVHRIELRDRGTDFAEFDSAPREVVLYPGNVATLHWEVTKVVVALGRLVTAEGEAIGRAHLQGEGVGKLVFTDQDGYFQAEVPEQGLAGLSASYAGEECQLQIHDPQVHNGVARLGKVVCQ